MIKGYELKLRCLKSEPSWKSGLMQVLTSILSRAVPDVQVESVEIVESTIRAWCWIQIRPDHEKYWERFMELYPHWKRVGFKYGHLDLRSTPTFPSRFLLMGWLSEVLGLTQGERKLLYLNLGHVFEK